jgi:hypothetical protein
MHYVCIRETEQLARVRQVQMMDRSMPDSRGCTGSRVSNVKKKKDQEWAMQWERSVHMAHTPRATSPLFITSTTFIKTRWGVRPGHWIKEYAYTRSHSCPTLLYLLQLTSSSTVEKHHLIMDTYNEPWWHESRPTACISLCSASHMHDKSTHYSVTK